MEMTNMEMKDYADVILDILAQMQSMMKKANVNLAKFVLRDKHDLQQYIDAHDWLLKIKNNQYKQSMDIWKLLSPAIWLTYEHMGSDDFREVKMLNDALSELKKAFKGRPYLFRKESHAPGQRNQKPPKGTKNRKRHDSSTQQTCN